MGLTLGTPAPPLPDTRSIAVVRANALGDLIFSLPALESLHAAYPDAEIVLLGREWHRAFLAGRPGPVRRVIPIPEGALGGEAHPTATAGEVARFWEAVGREHFNLALQMHGGGRNSNPFTLRLGARVTAGLRTPDAPALDRWIPYIYFQSEILRYLEVVGLVGAPPIRLEPHLSVTERDLAASRSVLPDGAEPLVVLHPGASDARRRWPPAHFAAVGRALSAEGARVVVTGTPDENRLAEQVTGNMAAHGAAALNLCGRLSLPGLIGLLSRAALVVSNDTGPLHVAAAVGTATVGIYWCFNLINSSSLSKARHRQISSWRLECPRCGRNCLTDNCTHTDSFVADVSVEEVAQHALDLLHVRD